LSLAVYFNILELNESWLWIGSTTAAAVKSSASATRLGSTVSTASFGNPIDSTIETGSSVVMAIVSTFLPISAIVLVFRLYKKIRGN